ncbi:selenium-dependent molybdenum cofactor biosynthesis protein YqeB [Thermotalea metallivorans]|uniref:Molybdenum hydroxylase n=1 Tax=Thermotalea metallivorans TaxID=520762 RepID=A0A140L146_9FIRM|nr:selenium-dependent molybdenum cofactor biosynthesis protein YqeB [Thermotalea metallivorans]KXG74271.1 hypothetical protein AN619_24630 [Thermotalea metallivorans]
MKTRGMVLIKGAGDIASGVAHKLFRCGFAVVMTEVEKPTCVRRKVSFANCIYEGTWEIEGIRAKKANTKDEILKILEEQMIPVVVDPRGAIKDQLDFWVLVDGIMAKKNTGTRKGDAPLVIGLGPGFRAGMDVDVVIETHRGHHLGRVIWEGEAEANTGIPGEVEGYDIQRVLKAPVGGIIKHVKKIGDFVRASEVISWIGHVEIRTTMDGVIRGLIYEGLEVPKGCKIGDIDPRKEAAGWIHSISDKARSIAGGVVEAILTKEWEEKNGAGI